jgi:hypothetical protein
MRQRADIAACVLPDSLEEQAVTDQEFFYAFDVGPQSAESVRRLEKLDFKPIAERLHSAGLDWFFVDKDYCFGIKVVGAKAANKRLGRLWHEDSRITLTFLRHARPFFEPLVPAFEACGGRRDADDRRYRFELQSFRSLLDEGELLQALGQLAGQPEGEGKWPRDYVSRPLS